MVKPSENLQSVPRDILDIAMRKATEAGLFPRHCSPVDYQMNRQVMETILLAALETSAGDCLERSTTGKSPRSECSLESHTRRK
jgi:hypothetical protein